MVRAADEDDARRVAHSGPALDEYVDPASEYGQEFDPEAAVQLVCTDGPRGLIDFHFG